MLFLLLFIVFGFVKGETDKYYVHTWEESKSLPAWIFGLVIAVLAGVAFFAVVAVFAHIFFQAFDAIFQLTKKRIRKKKSDEKIESESESE